MQKNTGSSASLISQAKEILQFLNTKTGRNYQPVQANLKLITARLRESSLQECKAIIAKKLRDWKGSDMEIYLRPATLFNATKFAQYQGELVTNKEPYDAMSRL